MIKLAKGDMPAVLAENSERWTEELEREIAMGGDRVRYLEGKYRNDEIKEALKAETHRKCAYCESKPLSVTYGDIEHITPKKGRPELAFDWGNLTLACDRCNTNKGTKDHILDPYVCDPDAEFEFVGPMIFHRRGRVEAERTRIELDLNRIDLIERRREIVDRISERLDRLGSSRNHEEVQLIKDTILHHETKAEREFAACARAFISLKAHELV